MAELGIAVTGASLDRYAAVPTISFSLQLHEASGTTVHAIALRTQVRIEPHRRRYSPAEAERLVELFGETPQWGESLRPFLWTHLDRTIGGFSGETAEELPMTCTYDFEVAGAKYLHSLGDGEIPLLFLFSGTVFTKGDSGFCAEPVPWHLESRFRLPVQLWRQTMDHYFPNAGWLRLSRRSIDQLQRYKARQAVPTWEQALDALFKQAGEQE